MGKTGVPGVKTTAKGICRAPSPRVDGIVFLGIPIEIAKDGVMLRA